MLKMFYNATENFPTLFLPLLPLSSQLLHLPPAACGLKVQIMNSSVSLLQGMLKSLKTLIWNDLSEI